MSVEIFAAQLDSGDIQCLHVKRCCRAYNVQVALPDDAALLVLAVGFAVVCVDTATKMYCDECRVRERLRTDGAQGNHSTLTRYPGSMK